MKKEDHYVYACIEIQFLIPVNLSRQPSLAVSPT